MKYIMKKQKLSFIFSKGEISIVRTISERRISSIRELSTIIGKSESSISKTIKTLEIKGIIKINRHGMNKSVCISDNKHASLLQDLFRNEPYIPWEKILSNSNMAVLFRNVTNEDSFEYNISSVNQWRATRNLSMFGMLMSPSNKVPLRNNNLSLFISEYSDYMSRKYLNKKLPKDAIIIWRRGYRCLFKIKDISKNEVDRMPANAFPTAVTVFPNYGIRFITSDSYYYYQPNLEKLSIEDIIIHTLLIDSESQTYSIYALLLAFKNEKDIDIHLLLKKSYEYGIADITRKFIKYIKTNGRIRKSPLPDKKELQEIADLYDMVVK